MHSLSLFTRASPLLLFALKVCCFVFVILCFRNRFRAYQAVKYSQSNVLYWQVMEMGDWEADYPQRLREAMLEAGRGEIEIARCVQYAQRLLLRNLPVLFNREHIWRVLRMNQIVLNKYHTFYIVHGEKARRITAPSRSLKARQRWILDTILSQIPVSPYAHGFEEGRSIKTNALIHAEHNYAFCLDIKDYFPSIPQQSAADAFQKAGYSASASRALADVCCYKGALPQGAPTSPRLSNIICRQLDIQLAEIAAKYDAVYTRYADDITFSADRPIAESLSIVSELLAQNGFAVNKRKTRIYGPGQPKEITGLIVQNGTVRVPKSFKRELKQEIYYCKKYGVLSHLEARQSSRFINYREYLYGKAYYVHMIEPERGEQFLRELDEIQWPIYV